MAEHPLDLSSRFIDSGVADGPHNRISEELSELGDDLALVESFSHVLLVRTDEGLVAFDSSGRRSGRDVVASIRGWSDEPIHTLVYTHGHLDHVGGSSAFAADADDRGRPRPRVLGHENVNLRLDRYDLTDGYNRVINLRQFGGVPMVGGEGMGGGRSFVPDGTLRTDTEYRDRLTETIGGVELRFHHAMGETDDHTWTWLPDHSLISAGDQFIWNFPNCGNPQKVQRYPVEWAQSLRAMVSTGAELFVPAHGLPIVGTERIRQCLETVASTLEKLVDDVLAAMNTGARLDAIVHEVGVDPAVLELPYLRPLYDEPEFVVHNLWRLYGGWYDGTPSRLKPASDASLGLEIASLAGGALRLADRAQALAGKGDLRLACHLADYAAEAEPESKAVHTIRAEIYQQRRSAERSLMAKGIFDSARAESEFVVTGENQSRSVQPSMGE
ncbi:MAG: MBL fold metallo-hydrolase [Actinomycetia bacterium]|nr:MBL fold metallo-hydrolase [Actinomycetes bacterium]